MRPAAEPRRVAQGVPAACHLASLLALSLMAAAGAARAEGACVAAEAAPGQTSRPPSQPACAEAGREGLQAVAFVWSAPHFALERPLSRAFRYAPHPHADEEPGLLRLGEPVPPLHNPRNAHVPRCPPAAGRTQAAGSPCPRRRRMANARGELTLAGGIDIDRRPTLYLSARMRTRLRLEPAVALSGFLSRRGAPHRWLGQYALDYRFAQAPRLHLRSGLGVLSYSRERATAAGAFLGYAVEWFPRAPFTFELASALGGVAGAFYGRLRAWVGFVRSRFELRLGYDHIALRGDRVTRLSGPQLAVRLWL